jgi:hypothetical protein
VYPLEYMHVTVASPLVFFTATKAYPSDAERKRVESAILKALDGQIASEPDFPRLRFPLKAVTVERARKAVIIRFEDPTGVVERVRETFERLRGNEELERMGVFDEEAGGFKMPHGIVHMTIARYIAEPGIPGSREEQAWCDTIDEVCSMWEAVEVVPDAFRMVREQHAYMHTDIPANVCWTLDLAEGGEKSASE